MIKPLAQGATRYNLSKSSFLNLQIPIPDPKEQERIANCLSALDELIDTETIQLANYQEYKQGLMQQLFPKTGEKTPKLRFKKEDGTDYPDWEVKKLGDVGNLGSTGIDKKYVNGDVEVYMVNFMDVYQKKEISKNTYTNLMITTAPANKLAQATLKKHDMLFLLVSETPADIGHSIVILDDFDDVVHSYHTVLLRPKIKLNLLFQKYMCNTEYVLREFSRVAKGNIRVFITKDDFNKIQIPIPDPKEQERIADCLSALDELIDSQRQTIENLKIYKQGLMQQLFPNGDI